jgi:hypothetical protein
MKRPVRQLPETGLVVAEEVGLGVGVAVVVEVDLGEIAGAGDVRLDVALLAATGEQRGSGGAALVAPVLAALAVERQVPGADRPVGPGAVAITPFRLWLYALYAHARVGAGSPGHQARWNSSSARGLPKHRDRPAQAQQLDRGMSRARSQGWIVGLVVSIVSVVLAAMRWFPRASFELSRVPAGPGRVGRVGSARVCVQAADDVEHLL